jgi:LacI family transcriptional regulator
VPDEFFVDILHALDHEAAARSRDVQFQLIRPATAPAGSGEEGDDRAATPDTWDALRSTSKASAGVILVGGLPPGATEHATTHRLPVPAVQIGAGDDLPGVSVVRVDNRHAGRAVAEHLLALGHRTTALLGPTTWYAPFAERREGYLETVRAAGGPEPLVVSNSHPDAATIAQLRQAGVTAVVCLYDRLALALLRRAHAAGIRIPTDWSLAGFDDMDWSAALSPSLTTVRIPRARLAAAAVERLEALIAASTPDPPDALTEPIVVIPELIVRESTASKAP